MLTCLLFLLSAFPAGEATRPPVEGHHGLAQYHRLRSLVMQSNACALPGITIKYDTFIPTMWNAVHKGFVLHEHAVFVANGLRDGFTAGIDVTKMTGHRWFRNYPAAMEEEAIIPLSTAIQKRVDAQKTLDLGVASPDLLAWVRRTFVSTAIFPMGCVDKSVEFMDDSQTIKAKRATDDHTRTGLNAATDMSDLRHSLDAYAEIAWFLQLDYFMRVSDVEAAYPMLPFHPDIWRFMLFRYVLLHEASTAVTKRLEHLFMHITGDFGTAGMPGVFHIFFVKVVVPMARCAQVLTLPMPVYVDDMGLIGKRRDQVDLEMVAFHLWAWEVCGVIFKSIKDRVAARCQLMIGFWWDSRSLTRSLDEVKLFSYMRTMLEFAARKTITLREMQSAAGKMQRAAMTLPPGAACLIVSIFTLMAGLRLPWHRRKVTKQARVDLLWMRFLLSLNMGKGYYSLAGFGSAPEVRSDASKSKKLTAGGYASRCGMYNWWKYGRNAARHAIDYLEGDSALQCWREMGPSWYKKVVPHGIDNMAFERSAEKGRSKVERLNCLLREAFALQVHGTFVVETYWISTHDNVEPDLLSRDQEDKFLTTVYETGFWAPGTVPIRHGLAGTTRVLPEKRGELTLEDFAISNQEVDSKSRHPTSIHLRNAAQPVARSDFSMAQRACMIYFLLASLVSAPAGDVIRLSVPYSRAHLTSGLPAEFLDSFELVMANRYTSSSWGTINAAINRWRRFADSQSLPVIIPTDHLSRGGWIVAWVLSMVRDTDLVFKSIHDYVWGMRVWQTLQHQADPIMGIMGWETFMAGVKVLAHVPSEPRKEMPLWVLERIIDETDWDDFAAVSLTFLLILLTATFSRSECPLPKSKTGRDSFDKTAHWRTCDMDIREYGRKQCLWIRFQRIKQDQRMERPEAAGNEDWSILGPIPGSKFCPVQAAIRFNRLKGVQAPDTPLFLDPADMSTSWTYDTVLRRYHGRQDDFGIPEEEQSGLHGGRIQGYNGVKACMGEDLAVAHGHWKSSAHKRYTRFKASDVIRISQAAFGLIEQPGPVLDAEERATGPPPERVHRHVLQQPAEGVTEEAHSDGGEDAVRERVPSSVHLLPPGWTEERKGQRGYLVCHGPRGEKTHSRAQAWQRYEEARGAPDAEADFALAASQDGESDAGAQEVIPNTHIRFDDEGDAVLQSPSPGSKSSRRRSRASVHKKKAQRAAAMQASSSSSMAQLFPEDLSEHVVEFQRASARPPPRVRD